MKRAAVLAGVMALALSLVPMASAQETVTLRIGLTQDWETLNPISGFTVSEYEIWNVHYATLTNKAAEDFATIPGLAESWEVSDDGLTFTYTLREGLLWSDGEPLTADDVAWNINTGREQRWINMVSTVRSLEATVIDDRTVAITSSVPDPKLPTLDVYLVPRHIWEPVAVDRRAARQYDALDGVGSGPFVVTDFTKGQSVTMAANPNFYGWEGAEPPIDQVIFQLFENPDAMVAALQQSQLDAIHGFPAGSAAALEADPNIEVVAGQQGGFEEIAINGGKAEGQPHPALLDLEVRRAISFGIDKAAVIEDLWFDLASPLEVMSPSADPVWLPEIPAENQFTYDPARANQILDEAGYLDTDDDGVREMPDGTNPIVLRHAVNTDGDLAGPVGELFAGWMAEIGIGVTLESYDQDALFGVIVDGTYDTFFWGWTPFVDPDPMLSYFTEAEIANYNDANWFDPAYEALYEDQKVELDPARRVEIVHEMLTILHDAAVYIPMYLGPDLQAYRTDTFEGWVQQPAGIGPVMFSNSSPSYPLLRPVGSEPNGGATDSTVAGDTTAPDGDGTTVAGTDDGDGDVGAAPEPGDDDGGTNLLLIGGIAAVVVLGGAFLIQRRRSTADERE
ncbi:MAG TPA: ABC transporter substrate-binding protein [Acidimicrobiia bacterium]|jgi:peptide/nickel transport system substrate-binding protein